MTPDQRYSLYRTKTALLEICNVSLQTLQHIITSEIDNQEIQSLLKDDVFRAQSTINDISKMLEQWSER